MGIRKQGKPGRLLVLGVALLAAVLALAWGQTSQPPAWAEETGPRLAFNLGGLNASCDAPSEPSECIVPLGGFFALSVEVIEAPAAGYILLQSFIDYGSGDYDPDLSEDGAGPGTCGDLLDNANDQEIDDTDFDCYVYTLTWHRLPPGEEVVWPDLASADWALRGETAPGAVNHSAFSGATHPLPVSHYEGVVVELVMSCSQDESTTELELIPLNDERVAGDGAGFVFLQPDGTTQVPSKPDFLTISCEEVVVESPTPPAGTEGPAGTATPAVEGFPPTGTFGDLDGEGGVQNAGLWATISALLAAAALALAFFGWRYARRRQAG